MTAIVLNGKLDAGNPHVRVDEGEVSPAKLRHGSLLYKKHLVMLGVALAGGMVLSAGAAQTLYWTGAGSNALWSNSANWTNSTGEASIPSAGDTLVLVFDKVGAKVTSTDDIKDLSVANVYVTNTLRRVSPSACWVTIDNSGGAKLTVTDEIELSASGGRGSVACELSWKLPLKGGGRMHVTSDDTSTAAWTGLNCDNSEFFGDVFLDSPAGSVYCYNKYSLGTNATSLFTLNTKVVLNNGVYDFRHDITVKNGGIFYPAKNNTLATANFHTPIKCEGSMIFQSDNNHAPVNIYGDIYKIPFNPAGDCNPGDFTIYGTIHPGVTVSNANGNVGFTADSLVTIHGKIFMWPPLKDKTYSSFSQITCMTNDIFSGRVALLPDINASGQTFKTGILDLNGFDQTVGQFGDAGFTSNPHVETLTNSSETVAWFVTGADNPGNTTDTYMNFRGDVMERVNLRHIANKQFYGGTNNTTRGVIEACGGELYLGHDGVLAENNIARFPDISEIRVVSNEFSRASEVRMYAYTPYLNPNMTVTINGLSNDNSYLWIRDGMILTSQYAVVNGKSLTSGYYQRTGQTKQGHETKTLPWLNSNGSGILYVWKGDLSGTIVTFK